MSTLCIFTDYTDLSHILCGEGLREEYKNFRIDFLHEKDWVSWHYKLVRATPYTCGWSIRKDKLEELKKALEEYKIPFVEKATFTPTVSAVSGKPPAQHTLKDMIYTAIKEQKRGHKGSSRHCIKLYIRANYSKLPLLKVFNNTLRKMVEKGELVKNGDHFKIGKVVAKTNKPKIAKPVSLPVANLAVYTNLWDEWEDAALSGAPRSVWGEYLSGGMTITIENKEKEEKFAVVCSEEAKKDEAYEEVAKIAWEQSKLRHY